MNCLQFLGVRKGRFNKMLFEIFRGFYFSNKVELEVGFILLDDKLILVQFFFR